VTIEQPHLCGTTRPALRLRVADACAFALAERLDLRDVATLDRRDLQVIAPRHLLKEQQRTILPGWTMALRCGSTRICGNYVGAGRLSPGKFLSPILGDLVTHL
jgi:hypothetical protein